MNDRDEFERQLIDQVDTLCRTIRIAMAMPLTRYEMTDNTFLKVRGSITALAHYITNLDKLKHENSTMFNTIQIASRFTLSDLLSSMQTANVRQDGKTEDKA